MCLAWVCVSACWCVRVWVGWWLGCVRVWLGCVRVWVGWCGCCGGFGCSRVWPLSFSWFCLLFCLVVWLITGCLVVWARVGVCLWGVWVGVGVFLWRAVGLVGGWLCLFLCVGGCVWRVLWAGESVFVCFLWVVGLLFVCWCGVVFVWGCWLLSCL